VTGISILSGGWAVKWKSDGKFEIRGMPLHRVSMTEVITLTFGDCAENHRGMQIIGQRALTGFSLTDLEAMQDAVGAGSEMYTLDSSDPGTETAHVLVLRGGVEACGVDPAALFAEQRALPYDRHALMYGRVVNKKARWNLCFDEEAQEPDYAAGKGRIVPFRAVPLLARLHGAITAMGGEATKGLKVESNYYYDAAQCGIGYHGDTERAKVVGVRLGTASLPIHYQWYHRGAAVGERVDIDLHPGDMYVMSDKAVGTDWKSPSKYTLRHAVGQKFI
jgi:alkylated DNA repair dioxygenase AlkB